MQQKNPTSPNTNQISDDELTKQIRRQQQEWKEGALWRRNLKQRIDEQEERVVRFGIGLYWFVNILWLLFALAFIITGAVLGGLGIIGIPALVAMVTIGCILLISLILFNCGIFSRAEPKNSSFSSSNSYDSSIEDGLPKSPSPAQSQTPSIIPIVSTSHQQNPEIYQDILQRNVPTPTTLTQETTKNNNNLTATL